MEEVSVRIEQILDYNSKVKFTNEMYANNTISYEEIRDSDVWVIHENEEDKCHALIMLQKKDEDGFATENLVRISHFTLKSELFEQDVLLHLYLQVEAFYVNNAVDTITVIFPKIRGFTTKATKFFKKVGFKKIIMYNSQFPEGAVLLLKTDLRK